MKAYIIATNTDFTLFCLAESKDDAISKANIYYVNEYDDIRNDWIAYKVEEWLNEGRDVVEIKIL